MQEGGPDSLVTSPRGLENDRNALDLLVAQERADRHLCFFLRDVPDDRSVRRRGYLSARLIRQSVGTAEPGSPTAVLQELRVSQATEPRRNRDSSEDWTSNYSRRSVASTAVAATVAEVARLPKRCLRSSSSTLAPVKPSAHVERSAPLNDAYVPMPSRQSGPHRHPEGVPHTTGNS